MPLPAADAVSRRDEALARTRRATRWMTTAAIAAAVVLSSAFAHALPGHHALAPAATSSRPAGSQARAGHGQGTAGRQAAAGRRHRKHRKHHHLQPPAQPPAPPPPSSPPPVVSGGS
jgi:hypothetical protein